MASTVTSTISRPVKIITKHAYPAGVVLRPRKRTDGKRRNLASPLPVGVDRGEERGGQHPAPRYARQGDVEEDTSQLMVTDTNVSSAPLVNPLTSGTMVGSSRQSSPW